MKNYESEYNSFINKIETKIDKIANLGIDTAKFNKVVKNIINEVENSNLKVQGLVTDSYLCDWAIRELKSLDLDLNEYDVYFKAISTCRYLEEQLNRNKNNNSDNVNCVSNSYSNVFADKIIEVLESINYSDKLPYEDMILNKIYNTVYNIIKFEIINIGESKVYNYINDYYIDSFYLNKYVTEEIKKLDLNDVKYSRLKERLYEIDSKGLDNNYFDLIVIKLLLYYDEKLDLNNNVNINFNNVLDELEKSNQTINEEVCSFSEKKDDLNKIISEFKKNRKNMIKSGISLILSLTVTIGAGVGIYKISKKNSYVDGYKTFTTTYSDWNGLDEEEGFIEKDKADSYKHDNLIYLNVYGVWEEIDYNSRYSQYQRNIKTYDISNYEFDNIETYLDYNIDYYEVDYISTDEMKSSVTDLYKKPYVEIKKTVIDKSEIVKDFDDEGFIILAVPLYMFYILIIMGIMGSTQLQFIFGQIVDLGYYLRKYIDNKVLTKEEQRELLENSIKILKMINSNNQLKEQFNKLYEENKFLLDNPEELYKRFDEVTKKVDTNEVKKLVR